MCLRFASPAVPFHVACVAKIYVYFQGSPFTVGDSVQHECNMECDKTPDPLPGAQCFHPEAWLALGEQERIDLARNYQRSAGYSPCRTQRRTPPFHAIIKQLEGALVTIDAMGSQVEIADKIVAHKADYPLALKGNQPTLESDAKDYFDTAPRRPRRRRDQHTRRAVCRCRRLLIVGGRKCCSPSMASRLA